MYIYIYISLSLYIYIYKTPTDLFRPRAGRRRAGPSRAPGWPMYTSMHTNNTCIHNNDSDKHMNIYNNEQRQ